MNLQSEVLIIKMISGQMRPVQNYDRENKKWVTVPNQEEKIYEVLCVTDDLVGEKVVFNTKVDYTKWEGKKVRASLAWNYNDFQKKMGNVTLAEIKPVEKA